MCVAGGMMGPADSSWTHHVLGVLSEPAHQRVEAKVVRLVKSCDEGIGLGAGRLQLDAVDGEECVSRCKCRPFVAVNEGVTLRKTFPERRRLFDDIRIVPCLRSE